MLFSIHNRRMRPILKWMASVVVVLLSWAAPGTAAGRQQLIEGAQKGNLALIKSELAKGADVNSSDKDGWTALTWAAWVHRCFMMLMFIC